MVGVVGLGNVGEAAVYEGSCGGGGGGTVGKCSFALSPALSEADGEVKELRMAGILAHMREEARKSKNKRKNDEL